MNQLEVEELKKKIQKLENKGPVIEAAARLLLIIKYGEKYRYSTNSQRLEDLAMLFALNYRRSKPKIGAIALANEYLDDMVTYCKLNFDDFVKKLYKFVVNDSDNNLTVNEEFIKKIIENLKKATLSKELESKLKQLLGLSIRYIKENEAEKTNVMCEKHGLGMGILAWKAAGFRDLNLLLETDGEGNIEFYDSVAVVSFAEIKSKQGEKKITLNRDIFSREKTRNFPQNLRKITNNFPQLSSRKKATKIPQKNGEIIRIHQKCPDCSV